MSPAYKAWRRSILEVKEENSKLCRRCRRVSSNDLNSSISSTFPSRVKNILLSPVQQVLSNATWCDPTDPYSEVLVCSDCSAAYHPDCSNPPISRVNQFLYLGSWRCNDCLLSKPNMPTSLMPIVNPTFKPLVTEAFYGFPIEGYSHSSSIEKRGPRRAAAMAARTWQLLSDIGTCHDGPPPAVFNSSSQVISRPSFGQNRARSSDEYAEKIEQSNSAEEVEVEKEVGSDFEEYIENDDASVDDGDLDDGDDEYDTDMKKRPFPFSRNLRRRSTRILYRDSSGHKIQHIKGVRVDPEELHRAVENRGGFMVVSTGKLWQTIRKDLNLPHTTSSSTQLREAYETHRHSLEKMSTSQ